MDGDPVDTKQSSAKRRCTKCGTPDTRRTIRIGKDGKCNVCVMHESRQTPGFLEDRKKKLDELIESIQGSGSSYDCLVPLSGGKDSVYVLYFLQKNYHLRTLAFTVDTGTIRDRAYQNMRDAVRILGADWVIVSLDVAILGRLMRYSLDIGGSLGWAADGAVAASSMRHAIDAGIPLVMFSHGLAEYAAYEGRTLLDPPEEVDATYFENAISGISLLQMADALRIDKMHPSLMPFKFPTDEELSEASTRGRFLSSYIKWDEHAQANEIIEALGWQPAPQEGIPARFSYEKMDCDLVGSIDYLKSLTQGYSRLNHILANEARTDRVRLSIKQAATYKESLQRPRSLSRILGIMEIDEEQFMKYAARHRAEGLRDRD